LASGARAQAAPARAEPLPGSVLAVGSAIRADNAVVWDDLARRAGGPGSRVAVFTAPAGNPDAAATAISEGLTARGLEAVHIRVGPRIAGQDLAAAVEDPGWVALLDSSAAAFISGGAQARLMDMLRPGGRDSALMTALQRLFDRGGLVAGESAGAAVMSEDIFREPPSDPLRALKAPLVGGRDIGRGLGLLRHDLVIDQHFLRRGRIARLAALMRQRGRVLGVGVEEHTAVAVQRDRLEVVGHHGVVIIDATSATAPAPSNAPFEWRGLRVWLLDHGDRFDLGSRTLEPAAARRARPPVAPGAAGTGTADDGPPRPINDILGEQQFALAMQRLATGGAHEVIGLAFDARPLRDDPAPTLGFEFRLRARPASLAWRERIASLDRWTVADLELDIVPVRIHQPLFKPFTL